MLTFKHTDSSVNLRVSTGAKNTYRKPGTLFEKLVRIGHATGCGLHCGSIGSSSSCSVVSSRCSYVSPKDGFSFGRITAANPRGLNLFRQLQLANEQLANEQERKQVDTFAFLDALGVKFVDADDDEDDDKPWVRRRFARASVASSGAGCSNPGSSFWANSVASSGPGDSHPSSSFWDN